MCEEHYTNGEVQLRNDNVQEKCTILSMCIVYYYRSAGYSEAIKGQNIAKEFHPHLYLELHYVWVHSVPEAKV